MLCTHYKIAIQQIFDLSSDIQAPNSNFDKAFDDFFTVDEDDIIPNDNAKLPYAAKTVQKKEIKSGRKMIHPVLLSSLGEIFHDGYHLCAIRGILLADCLMIGNNVPDAGSIVR